ncbi:hypothetical protein IAR55_003035 [Kwoniella newhampshirensis]|uniref:Uncharacterized protein n=1 Tax=Kwoniella newhampshirensis TaxID=1651941 RepID=A0AAW0Z1H3_9TREE
MTDPKLSSFSAEESSNDQKRESRGHTDSVSNANDHLHPLSPSLPFKSIQSYSDWSGHGVWLDIPNTPSPPTAASYDMRHLSLIPMDRPSLPIDVDLSDREEIRRRKKREQNQPRSRNEGTTIFRLEREDCWRIGDPSMSWEEPEGTSLSDYNPAIPPFTRLLSATRDFIQSRDAGFQFQRDKRLFNLLRNTLGLRSDFAGNHWNGRGPAGMPYNPPRSTGDDRRGRQQNVPIRCDKSDNDAMNEVCVLLRLPETSIRGFLALARKEAEAGWDFGPALKLSQITAAFMSFLAHYDVISEPQLKPAFQKATNIARSAPQQLVDAKYLEEAIARGTGWNRACWTVWGGSYGGAERGGLEKEDSAWATRSVGGEDISDDGGWTIPTVIDDRPEPMSKGKALPHLTPLIHPMYLSEISLIHYIPYSRRRIVAVLPPVVDTAAPPYSTRCHRLVTVPAPWTAEEKWRVHPAHFEDESLDDDADASANFDLDDEHATIDEPDEIIIWVESSLLSQNFPTVGKLIGMGLRGRWGLMGAKSVGHTEYHQWWTFKAKDFTSSSARVPSRK